jgi:hypothetical protein
MSLSAHFHSVQDFFRRAARYSVLIGKKDAICGLIHSEEAKGLTSAPAPKYPHTTKRRLTASRD